MANSEGLIGESMMTEVTLFVRAKGLFNPQAMTFYRNMLLAQTQHECAALIFDRAAAIARDAVDMARQAFERSALMHKADALSSAERDLFAFANVCARSILTQNQELEFTYLRQVAMASNRAMDFPDSSPLLLGFAWSAAAVHLQGHALRHFRAKCELGQEVLRNAASGAALSNAASAIAKDAYPMLASAHPELAQIYGAVTQAKCERDLTMMLGTASRAWLTSGSEGPMTAWLTWMFKAIGPHVGRYSGDLWGGVFASLCAAALGRVGPAQASGCGAGLLEIAISGQTLRRALHGVQHADDAANLSSRRSADLATAPIHQERVAGLLASLSCASVVHDYRHADKALTNLLDDVLGSDSNNEQLLLGLSAIGSETMGIAFTPFVAKAIDQGCDRAREFGVIQQQWRAIPIIASAACDSLAKNLEFDPAAMTKWLSGILALTAELAVSRAPEFIADELTHALLRDYMAVSGTSSGIEGLAVKALVRAAKNHDICLHSPILDATLNSLSRMADCWTIVSEMLVSSEVADAAATESWGHGLRTRICAVLLSCADPVTLQNAARWLATSWVAHARFGMDWQSIEASAEAEFSAALAKLGPEFPSLESHVQAFSTLQRSIADACFARTALEQAEVWGQQALKVVIGEQLWSISDMQGGEDRCRRDFGLMIKFAACLLGAGHLQAETRILRFAHSHLLPFLRPESRRLGIELVDTLFAIAGPVNFSACERFCALLRVVYERPETDK